MSSGTSAGVTAAGRGARGRRGGGRRCHQQRLLPERQDQAEGAGPCSSLTNSGEHPRALAGASTRAAPRGPGGSGRTLNLETAKVDGPEELHQELYPRDPQRGPRAAASRPCGLQVDTIAGGRELQSRRSGVLHEDDPEHVLVDVEEDIAQERIRPSRMRSSQGSEQVTATHAPGR